MEDRQHEIRMEKQRQLELERLENERRKKIISNDSPSESNYSTTEHTNNNANNNNSRYSHLRESTNVSSV
jgi:hypothetical protein